MIFALILMGILGGGYHPMASPLLADTINIEKRGQALGVHQIGGTLANVIVPLLYKVTFLDQLKFEPSIVRFCPFHSIKAFDNILLLEIFIKTLAFVVNELLSGVLLINVIIGMDSSNAPEMISA